MLKVRRLLLLGVVVMGVVVGVVVLLVCRRGRGHIIGRGGGDGRCRGCSWLVVLVAVLVAAQLTTVPSHTVHWREKEYAK